jgi:hypothetical protein
MKNIWFIQLHRRIRDNLFYQEKRVFSKFEAWIEILLECNFSENKFLLWNKIIDVERWSFICSKNDLARKLWWEKRKLYRFLKMLEDEKMVVLKCVWWGYLKKSLISVLNYSKYQIDGTLDSPLDSTSKTPPKNNNKKYNKIKKEIKHKYWEYSHILLLDSEKEKFINDFSENEFFKYIKILDEYIETSGKVYKNHILVMRKFRNSDLEKNNSWKKEFEKSWETNFTEWL